MAHPALRMCAAGVVSIVLKKDERPPTAKASRNSAPVQAIVDDEFSPAWVARHANVSDADIYDPSVGEFQ